MKLATEQYRDAEVIHYFNSETDDMVYSRGRKFFARLSGHTTRIEIDLPFTKRLVCNFRLGRRLLRLDKGNAIIVDDGRGVMILYQGWIYYYDIVAQVLERVHKIRVGRNALHCGVLNVDGQNIYFGEYFSNPDSGPVCIHHSQDGGRSWHEIYRYNSGSIRHIHGIFQDPYTDKIWVATGDHDGQCHLAVTDPDFSNVDFLGDGTQKWRAVSLLFTKDAVTWGMDSPLDAVHVMRLDKKSGALTAGQSLPGSVWYAKSLTDGVCLMQTSVERGPSITSQYARLYASRDLEHWQEIAAYKKDALAYRYFKNGVIAFADGPQTSKRFVFHAEALRGIDGRSYFASLTGTGGVSD